MLKDYLDSRIFDRISSADVIVFEGFEMTGKSYLAKLVNSEFNSILYRPDWEQAMVDEVVSRGNRYIAGLVVVDFWKSVHEHDKKSVQPKLLIDRWMTSSYVYQVRYDQKSDVVSLDKFVQAYSLVAKGLDIVIIHKQHSSREEAQKLYELSRRSSDHSDIYDKFDNFNEYYRAYSKFNDTYQEFYNTYCKFPVYVVSSLYNHLLNRRG